jgi:hypothetical protein
MVHLRLLVTRLFGNSPGTGWRHARILGLAAVALVLLVEGFVLRNPYEPAPRDIDASVKRAQTLALAESGFLQQSLPYRARYLDPQQWYLPFVKPFVLRTRTGMQSIFPTVAAAVDVPAEWLGGLAAVRFLSIVAMLVAVAATLRCLRVERDPLAPVVLVLATPLWFYAFFGSSHPVGLALATIAVSVALNHGHAFLIGLLLGLAATVREEVLVLLPGLAIVCAWRWRRLRPLLQLALGVIVPLAVVGIADVTLYGRPAAAHLLHALTGTFFPDLPSGALPALKTMTWLERFDVVFVFWLDGRSRLHVVTIAVLAVLAVAVRHRWGSYWGAVPVLALVMFDVSRDFVTMIESPRRTPGLLRLAPFMVFALLPHPLPEMRTHWRRRAVLLISALFILIAFLTTNTDGGRPLGPRLLLSVWPLLALAAWQSVRTHLELARTSVPHRILAAIGVMLVAAGLFFNAVRLMPLYRFAERDAQGAARYLAGAAEEVIVMGNPFTINPVIGAYPRKSVLLASSAADARDIAERLAKGRIRRFLYVRRNDREDLAAEFPSYAVAEELTFGRWVVQRWEH